MKLIYKTGNMQFEHKIGKKAYNSIIKDYGSIEKWLRELIHSNFEIVSFK